MLCEVSHYYIINLNGYLQIRYTQIKCEEIAQKHNFIKYCAIKHRKYSLVQIVFLNKNEIKATSAYWYDFFIFTLNLLIIIFFFWIPDLSSVLFPSWPSVLKHHGGHLCEEELALSRWRTPLAWCPSACLCQQWRRLWWRFRSIGDKRIKKVITPKNLTIEQIAQSVFLRLKPAVFLGRCCPVRLEQVEDDCPCVLTLSCSSSPLTSISRLLVISEARTMEVYSQEGDYCGTAKGERDDSIQTERWTIQMPQYRVS